MAYFYCYGCGKPPPSPAEDDLPMMEVDGKWWHPVCESHHRRRARAAESAFPEGGSHVAMLVDEGGL